MNNLPKWLEEQIELHENCENYECGCNTETLELCIAGNYINGGYTLEDIIEEFGFE